MSSKRFLAWCAGVAASVALAFPPIVAINGDDVAYLRYRFLLSLHDLRWGTLLWPVTALLLLLEWLAIVGLAAAAYRVAAWVRGRARGG